MAIFWRRGQEVSDGFAVHRIRAPVMEHLDARQGRIDSRSDAVTDYLEPVRYRMEGAAVQVKRLGAL
eukprot:12236042-Karenia_brevis.AAC.1